MEENIDIESKTKTTTKPKLNALLVSLLIIGIIGIIPQYIIECMAYEMWYGFSYVFCVTAFILAFIHIAGIFVILLKKSIIGY
jgi:hypothetical protein